MVAGGDGTSLYPRLLEDRKAYKRQYGRSRIVALWSGLITLLRQHRQLRIILERKGQMRNIRTPTLFVCNNQLQMEQMGIPLAEALEGRSRQGAQAAARFEHVSVHCILVAATCEVPTERHRQVYREVLQSLV